MKSLIDNWRTICIKKNFIGIGSTRKVYRMNDRVIKVHLNSLGYHQSRREYEIYNDLIGTEFARLLAPIEYVDKNICLQKYYREVPMHHNQSFDIQKRSGNWSIPRNYEATIKLLDEVYDAFDLKDSSNYGIDERGELVLIDYGMSKKIYESQWVPKVENGEIPQIEFSTCEQCGEKKEIRVYGENDSDIRCVDCGKE
ncbi:hypothetical protein [Tenuibacillus multivorans]|uniref:Protein kinase domain-containing protein n=1 Tax=Tenuibacillus multivorans TaxID=237069 RepID=A0A1H0ARS6_9BACI|nr:hypothetical protein [Tenuibacillus multivorans]GEL77853.1 hypothetical protein TMU01_20880 [Tenuibacillus multivorans]SDN36034.1 hypothetical protein SAMN05216498_2042 [Tenuibacillus multivorans]